MICKFFPEKKHKYLSEANRGIAACDYLLNSRVSSGTARILLGDDKLTKQIIRNIPYDSKATVGCLAFTEQDLPEQSKYEIMENFEQMLFPGLDKEQYNILWVEHTDKKNLELNFVIPKIELRSGKSLQPYYYKQDQKRKDLWQQIINNQYKLSNPLDPRRMQRDKNKTLDLSSAQALKSSFEDLVSNNQIKSRDELISLLKLHEIVVTRIGKEYISIKLQDKQKASRLKGEIFSETFTCLSNISLPSSTIPDIDMNQLEKDFNELMKYKKNLQKKKYPSPYNQKEEQQNDTNPRTTTIERSNNQAKAIGNTRDDYQRLLDKVGALRDRTSGRNRVLKAETAVRYRSARERIIGAIKKLFTEIKEIIHEKVIKRYR